MATGLYLLLEPTIVGNYAEHTSLFTDNYYYVVFLSFLMLYSNFFEGYMMALKKNGLASLLKQHCDPANLDC